MMLRHLSCLPLLLILSSSYLATFTSASLDVVFLLDTTKTVELDFIALKASMPGILSQITNTIDSDTRFGVASFQDYAIEPYGKASAPDTPYTQQIDLTSNQAAVLTALAATPIGLGGDNLESGLAALYQMVTGAGQLYGQNQNIPANQEMNFRSTAQKVVVLWTDSPFHDPLFSTIGYPGPSYATVTTALQNGGTTSRPIRFVGLSIAPTQFSTAILANMTILTSATGAKATRDFTCYTNGGDTITQGEDLLCTGVNRMNSATLTEAFVNIVQQAYFIDNPNGGSTPTTLACFAATNTVIERTRGPLFMDQVRAGDWLLDHSSDNTLSTYSRVLTVAHRHTTVPATFVQIYTNTSTIMELTADHLVFVVVDNGTRIAQPASRVRPGDRLVASTGVVVVTDVTTVQRRGIYAPITASGTFLVGNGTGIKVSSYVQVFPQAWTDPHTLGHLFFAPWRVMRLLMGTTLPTDETHDATTGYSHRLQGLLSIVAWLQQRQSHCGGAVVTLVVAPVFGLCWVVEQILLLWTSSTTSRSSTMVLSSFLAGLGGMYYFLYGGGRNQMRGTLLAGTKGCQQVV